ncbi:MAG: prephenate dehydrogenase/arogenate dehydrogenase family protein, partial [Nevskiales bacterium]
MSAHAPIRRLAVVGLGLIGGSLARALRAAGAVGSISGFDTDAEQVRQAQTLGVIDIAATSAEQAVKGADVVLVAVPVLATGAALRACAPALTPEMILTDVGST